MASKKLRNLFHLLKKMLEDEKKMRQDKNCKSNLREEAIPQSGSVSPLSSERNTQQPSYLGNQFFRGIPENTAQFHLNSGSSGLLDIVVGVDFGTSSTKVVLRAPTLPGNPAFAVPFGDLAKNSLKYLLPTRLFVDKDGLCSLNSMPENSIITDIKVGLLHDPLSSIESASGPTCEASAITIATAYLALVLRYVRCWFIASKRGIFGEYTLRWSFNLGLPAAIDDNPKLREAFETSGKAAWIFSRRTGPITIAATQDAIDDIKCSRVETDCAFDLLPEVIAEVAGYVKSRFRNEGLHLLVDIGASTLDVCSFNLHVRGGDDQIPILTADLDMFGAKRLHLARTDRANAAVINYAANLVDESDPGSIIPDNIEVYLPTGQETIQKILNELNTTESEFQSKCEKLLRLTIIDLRRERDPHSPRWSEELPVFVCGGARDMQLYKKTISKVHHWLRDDYIASSNGIRRIELPKPESLEAEIDDKSYHRLAVANGLSHESFNIGKVTRPVDIKDIPPPEPSNWRDSYISKDVV